MTALALSVLPPGRYKVLTLRQPWAWVVVHGGKNIENRSWYTKYRGPLLIHAGSEMTRREYDEAVGVCGRISPHIVVPPRDALEFGVIIGRTTVVAVYPPRGTPYRFGQQAELAGRPEIEPWHFPEQYGWVLEDTRPYAAFACKGAQGLWQLEVDEDDVLGTPTALASRARP